MKKISILIGLLVFSKASFSQQFDVVSNTTNEIVLKHELQNSTPTYCHIDNQAYIDYGKSHSITMMKKGAPMLPKFSESVVLPNKGATSFTVEHDGFVEYTNILVAPSKGSLKRNVIPSNIPYEFGEAYNTDAFFPGELASPSEVFNIRQTRGVTVSLFPYQYNPVTKTLRVYKNIRIKVNTNPNVQGVNELNNVTVAKDDFAPIYKSIFINSVQVQNRYTVKEETGEMLIICPDSYKTTIQPLADWKNQKGIKTVIATTAQTGTTVTAIKSYLSTYYSSNPNLIYVLLVGDHAQIPAHSYGTSSEGEALWSDSYYAQLAGGASDYHPEVFIGRFSGSTSDVLTMVNRTLEYEKTPSAGDWMNKAIGLASNEGAGQGDDGEADWQHARNMRTKLMGYGYGTVHELYDGSQGGADAAGNPSSATVGAAYSAGVGLFNYTGHGDQSSMISGNFSVSSVNSATNSNKYPWVISVACNNGTFTSGTCLAEAFLRAGTSSTPKGAIVTCASSILMAWAEPMQTQDELAEIISESYANNKKRTIGGIFYNSQLSMLETHNNASASEVMQTWVMFGDPSTLFRTKQTQTLSITHDSSVPAGTTSIAINCSTEGALICITQDNVILGTGIVSGGVATITVPAISGSADLLVTGTNQNYAAFQDNITIGAAAAPSVTIATSNSTICSGTSVTFTATPTSASNPSYQWTVNGTNVGTNSPTYTTTGLSNGANVACVMTENGSPVNSNAVTMTVNTTPSSPSISSNTPICEGTSINLTTTSQSGVTYQWTGPNNYSSTAQNPTISNAATSMNGSYELVVTSNGCSSTASTSSIAVTPSVTPSNSIAVTAGSNPNCSGQPITFGSTATNGGTSPSYNWMVNGTNVGTGTSYTSSSLNNNDLITCTLTSNATCATSTNANSNAITISITSSITPSVAIQSTQTTYCSGTPITVNATGQNGGTNPTYVWKVNGTIVNGQTSTAFTSSTLVNGDVVTCEYTSNSPCASTPSATSNTFVANISDNVAPSVQISASTNSICAGESVTFTSNAQNQGTSPTYAWTINGNAAGNNSSLTTAPTATNTVVSCVITSSEACTTNANATSNTVTVNVTPTPTATPAVNSPLCEGELMNLTCNGTSGATYTWTGPNYTSSTQNGSINNVQASASGTYTVTVDVSGCTTTESVSAVVNPAPTTPTISSSGNILTSSSTTANQWYFNGIEIAGATSQSITADQSGNYSVIANNNGCFSGTSDIYNYTVNSNGLSESTLENEFLLYPNPTTGILHIAVNSENQEKSIVSVYTTNGLLVQQEQFNSSEKVHTMNLTNLSKGVYFIDMNNSTKKLKVILF